MGLTYKFDSLGFVNVNGLGRDTVENDLFCRRWITMIIHASGIGGKASDTAIVSVGTNSGPDSIVVKTGDIVFVAFTGDDDRDTVPNCIAKLYGISGTTISDKLHDYDNDGVSNFREIYGWVSMGSGDTIKTDPANADTDGDGFPDGSDPKPLNPYLALSSNVKSLSVLDPRDSIVETISFTPSEFSKPLSKDVPYIPHFQVTVDTMPSWCKLTVNQDTLLLVYDTIVVTHANSAKPDTLYRFIDNPLTERKSIPLGNVTIKVITKPLDNGKTKEWNSSGKSGLINIMGKPVVQSQPVEITTDGGSKWLQQLNVQISCKKQHDFDPRATGYKVVRSVNATDTFDVSSKTGQLDGTTHNGWVISKTITGDSIKRDLSYIDTGLISGTTYYYRVIPYYSSDNVNFTYGSSPDTVISDSTRTWKIMVKPQHGWWYCHITGDGDDAAEIKWRGEFKKSLCEFPGAPVLITPLKSWSEQLVQNVKSGTMKECNLDSIRGFEFKFNEKLIWWFWMYEDDEVYDDILWEGDILNINIETLVNAANVNDISVTDMSVLWDMGSPPPFVPNSGKPNRVRFGQQKSNGTVVDNFWYIYWWFE